MNIISHYNCKNGENKYSNFVCELNKNTLLKLEILNKNECKVTMEDVVSGIVDISAVISNDDIDALIRTLRNISVQMGKLDDKKNRKEDKFEINCAKKH